MILFCILKGIYLEVIPLWSIELYHFIWVILFLLNMTLYKQFERVSWCVTWWYIMIFCWWGLFFFFCVFLEFSSDLKAENLLLGSDGSWKLCDFGSISTNHKRFEKPEEMGIEEDNIRKHTTPAYRAPEVIRYLFSQIKLAICFLK